MKKITAQEIKEALEEHGPVTVEGLAKRFGVSPKTIRRRFRILRKDNLVPIVHNGEGNFILNKVETEDEAESLRVFLNWLLAIYQGALIIAIPTKKLMPAASRLLREGMSVEERRNLSKTCSRIRGLIEQAEVDEELVE